MFFTAIAVFISCDVDDSSLLDNRVIAIKAVYPSPVTKVNSLGFDVNDGIGVYVTPEGALLQAVGNSVNNGHFTFNGSTWESASPYYWETGVHDVYAYYPYMPEIFDTEDAIFKIAQDQSDSESYGASDFLWAKTASQLAGYGPVTLKFGHIMSKVVVELVKGDKYEGVIPENAEVYIHNTVPVAVIDLTTGSAGKDGYSGVETIKMQKLSTGRYACIIVPQMIESRRPLVEVVIGHISYMMEAKMSFKQGMQHTLTVTLASNPEQSQIEIGGGIGNWN